MMRLIVAALLVTAAVALTPEQLAGQRVVYSYAGSTVPSALLERIRANACAGVIFFGENIPDTKTLSAAVKQLRAAAANTTTLLLMTDQEGGMIRRLPGEPLLSQKQVGTSADPLAAATAAGIGAGNNLLGVGLNVNLAPVLDVFYATGNMIDQYGRSYSHNSDKAASLGVAFVTAQQKLGVAATVKHFPGLGAAARGENTDERPVTLNVSLASLHSVDLVPYPPSFAAGAKLTMVSWATYPALDAENPAGHSSTVVRQLLRKEMGFQGVTITDALEAGALIGPYADRAVAAAAAGMDLILCSARDVDQGDQAVAGLAAAYSSGKLDQADFMASVSRVAALRQSLL